MNKRRAFAILIFALLPVLAACGDEAATATSSQPILEAPTAMVVIVAAPTATAVTDGAASPTTNQEAQSVPTRTPRSFGPTATAVVRQADAPTASTALDVCALLREAGAADILGSPSEEPEATMPVGGPIKGSCAWKVAGGDDSIIQPRISLVLYSFPVDTAQNYAEFVSGLSDTGTGEAIAGLGDEAAWQPAEVGGSLVLRKGSLIAHFHDWKFPRERVEALAGAVATLLPQ